MPIAATTRSARLGLRATPQQETVLRRAADVAHKSLTDFILDAAYRAAEQTLLDQRIFVVSSSQYQALLDILDRPESDNQGLNDLFSVRTSSTTVKGVRDGYTAGSRKYVRHSQCMPMHRDEKGRAVCSTLPIKINSININPLKFIVMFLV